MYALLHLRTLHSQFHPDCYYVVQGVNVLAFVLFEEGTYKTTVKATSKAARKLFTIEDRFEMYRRLLEKEEGDYYLPSKGTQKPYREVAVNVKLIT